MNYKTLEDNQDEKSLILDKYQDNNNQPKNQDDEPLIIDTFFLIRCFIIIFAISFITLNTVYGFALPSNNIECLIDKVHDFLGGFNRFFHDNINARHALIITSSLFVDFNALFIAAHWACYGKSFRVIISLIIFYGLRAIIQVKINVYY